MPEGVDIYWLTVTIDVLSRMVDELERLPVKKSKPTAKKAVTKKKVAKAKSKKKSKK